MALTKISGSVIKDSVSLSGNVSVGGTLTYQDVTNVDALGIGTFRTGINVSGGQLDVGSNIKIGNAGVITATTFVGNLTGNPTGTLQTAAQPNITSVGTLSALTVSGNINVTSSDPTIVFVDSDNNPDFDIKAGGGRFAIRDSTNNAERLYITSDGKFGINQSSPTADLEVCPIDALADTATIFINAKNHDASVASEAILKLGYNQSHGNDSIGYVKLIEAGGNSYDGHLTFGVPYNNSGTPATREALRITSSGRLIIGHTATYAVAGHYPHLQLSGTTYSGATLGIINNANDATGAYIQLSKQRSGSPAGATIVQNDDLVGNITFTAADGTDLTSRTAEIKGHVDGTPGSNDTPGRLSFWTTPDGAQSSLERVRIDSSGRLSVGRNLANYVASNMSSAANDFIITTGAGSNGGMSIVNSGADIGNIFFAHGSSENSVGRIQYNHNGDDFIFTAGGNARGRIYNDAGVTGIEHHRFIPFLVGYDIQSTSSIVMSKGFGGMSRLPMNADGDRAYMSYVTHWRHREYALVRFWYGASGNTSGATFDWDFTVWNASSGQGYSASSHTFTVTSGTMSNGKMYGYNIVSSWPTHASAKFVQFEILYDELQEGTSLNLVGLELVEYTTP